MIPLHLPYYSQSAKESVRNFVLGLNERDFHTELSSLFQTQFNLQNTFLTKSCTNALEAIALLLEIKPGDEIIMPSYTFVSSANAFALFGAKIVFADSDNDHPNAGAKSLLALVTPKTKAILAMHYGAVAINDLELLREECDKKKIFLIEDAAHCMGAYFNDRHLGSFGHASAFSFHESKNVTCIEGGLLVINHAPWLDKINSILNKGTNRVAFEKKQVAFYEWVSLGSSFKMNALHAAILIEQIKHTKEINDKRIKLYKLYAEGLNPLKQQNKISFNVPSGNCRHNAHNFWIRTETAEQHAALQKHLAAKNIFSTFHYLALHNSPYGKKTYPGKTLRNAENFEKTLLRLPLYFQQEESELSTVINEVNRFFS